MTLIRKFKNFGFEDQRIKQIEISKAIAGNDILEVTYENGEKCIFTP